MNNYQGYDVEKEVEHWTQQIDDWYENHIRIGNYYIHKDDYNQRSQQRLKETEHGIANLAAELSTPPIFASIEDHIDNITAWLPDHTLFVVCYLTWWSAFILALIIWIFMGYL